MEGVGSRLGRASSRYGPSTTAAVFNGPVRKWKKKWVHVSPSSSTSTATQQHNSNSHSHSNGHSNNNGGNSRLLLCRWTPLSPADATSEEPPKRKFRYTPVVVIEEEQRKVAQQVDDEALANHEAKTDETKQYTAMQTSKNDEPSSDTALKTETQDANMSNLDLGLCLKGHNEEDPGSVGQTNESPVNKASSGGFWTAG